MLLDPMAPETLDCWRSLAGHVAAPHQGQAALAMGQRLTSAGLTLELLADRGQLAPVLFALFRKDGVGSLRIDQQIADSRAKRRRLARIGAGAHGR